MRKTILSTVDVARLFNVTETTVKRWADDGTLRCHKTPGGHRKFPMRNVVEFAERSQLEPLGVLAMPKSDEHCASVEMAILNRDFPALVKAFVEKALSPDRNDLYIFFSYLYEHRIALWEIQDNVVRPGMAEIGMRWARGELTVSQEHRASYETLDALARLQSEIFIKPANGKSVVLACPGGEQHEIGLRSASYIFEAEGWTVHYIGASTPVSDVVKSLHDLKPTLLALSMTYTTDPARLMNDVTHLSEEAAAMGIGVVLGGSGVPEGMGSIPSVDATFASAQDVLAYLSEKHG